MNVDTAADAAGQKRENTMPTSTIHDAKPVQNAAPSPMKSPQAAKTDPAPKPVKEPKGAKKAKAVKRTAATKKPADKGERSNKKQEVMALMKRPKGVTLEEIMKRTGWQAHTVRGFVSILGSKGGVKIESSKNASGGRTYRSAK